MDQYSCIVQTPTGHKLAGTTNLPPWDTLREHIFSVIANGTITLVPDPTGDHKGRHVITLWDRMEYTGLALGQIKERRVLAVLAGEK